MLTKTELIVLHTVKYRETSLIVHTYSRDHGRTAWVAHGVRQQKSKLPSSWFAPMSHLSVVGDLPKQSNGLGRIREATPCWLPLSQSLCAQQLAMLYFVAELIYRSYRQETTDEAMFNFLREALRRISYDDRLQDYPLWFLLHYIDHMGLLPASEQAFLQELGRLQLFFWDERAVHALQRLRSGQLASGLPSGQRHMLVQAMLHFVSEHTTHFRELKGIGILRQLMQA